MTREEKYKALLKLEKEIDMRLRHTDFDGMKELLLFLAQSEDYLKMKSYEQSLRVLDTFAGLWIEEKKKLTDIGINDDIFYHISSLKDAERKYHIILFGVLRFETAMPEEYYEQVIDNILEEHISGIALGQIIANNTVDRINNAVKISRRLNARGETVRSICMLQKMATYFPEDKDILLELAGCWMDGQQWEQALECLKKIKEPDKEVQAVIEELEKVLK
jgi:tetratricopeptide (TPR) repeat protein